MTATQDEIGKKNTIAVIFSHVAVFLVAAPIIESVAGVIVGSLMLGIYSPFKILFGFLLHTISSYIAGGLAASFTGLLVAIASNRLLRPLWLFPFAFMTGGAFSIVNLVLVRSQPTPKSLHGLVGFALFFVVTGSASAICTALTRPFRQELHPSITA